MLGTWGLRRPEGHDSRSSCHYFTSGLRPWLVSTAPAPLPVFKGLLGEARPQTPRGLEAAKEDRKGRPARLLGRKEGIPFPPAGQGCGYVLVSSDRISSSSSENPAFSS